MSQPNVLICQTRNALLQRKSFTEEVRARRDLESFLRRPQLVLDCQAGGINEAIEQMLQKLHQEVPPESLKEATRQLLSPGTAQLANIIQNVHIASNGQQLYDPSWLCTYASVNLLKQRQVVIARLKQPTNFGSTLSAVQFLIVVLVPIVEKATKSAFEVARTFSTLFSDATLQASLLSASNEAQFCVHLCEHMEMLKAQQSNVSVLQVADENGNAIEETKEQQSTFKFTFGQGVLENFSRRLKYYPSDFIDGITGEKTWLKVPAATLSLFFACILPCVAFGFVNEQHTAGAIGPKEALLGQAIGGLVFALFSGQPLVIIATTAPLCLYTQVVYRIADSLQVAFFDLFAAVGLWNAFFLLLYVLFDLSQLMAFCTRSTEEIFATFIFFAFTVDALTQCVDSFKSHYCFANSSTASGLSEALDCSPDKSILFLFLMLGTVAFALMLYNFSSTPYLSGIIRETLADYALPISVIAFSLIGSLAFSAIQPDSFTVSRDYRWQIAKLSTLNVQAILLSLVLGFALSILFFIDQNVSAALVSAPSNRLKKGDAYHWDLLVVGLLNALLSLFGLPWMHGILPHSPMHARALADVVPLTDENNPSRSSFVVLRVRETRISGILIHVLIALVVTLYPELLSAIPVAVLSGLFLYCAAGTLRDNSLYQRLLLLVTEQTAYPPTHYLRRCPQRTVHYFTAVQVLQLAIICFFGFAPWQYVQLIFPLIIGLLIPIRWFILPRFCDNATLSLIDNKHC